MSATGSAAGSRMHAPCNAAAVHSTTTSSPSTATTGAGSSSIRFPAASAATGAGVVSIPSHAAASITTGDTAVDIIADAAHLLRDPAALRHIREWSCGSLDPSGNGHSDCIRRMIQLSDGRIVTASADKTLRIWNAMSGRCELILIGHTEEVHDVTSIPRDDTIVSASIDTTIRLWNPHTGECITKLKDLSRNYGIWGVATGVTPSGDDVIFSGDAGLMEGGLITMWKKTNTTAAGTAGGGKWEFVRYLDGVPRASIAVSALALLPHGLLASLEDKFIRIWRPNVSSSASDPSELVQTLGDTDGITGHSVQCTVIRLLPNGNIVTAGQDCTIRVWDVSTSTCLHVLEGHTDNVWDLAVFPDGDHIISSSIDGSLRVWSSATGECLRVIADAMGPDWKSKARQNRYGWLDSPYALHVLPHGSVIVGSFTTGRISLFQ